MPKKIALMDFEEENYTIKISSPERSILECVHISPKYLFKNPPAQFQGRPEGKEALVRN